MTKKKDYTFQIKGKDWTVKMLSSTTFKRLHTGSVEGVTLPSERELHFDKNYFSHAVFFHECLHALVAESNTGSSSLTSDQTEELCCELLYDYHAEMYLWFDKVSAYYRGR